MNTDLLSGPVFRGEWISGRRMIRRVGTYHVFPINDTTEHAAMNANWAAGIFSAPAVVFPNGRSSHEVAREQDEKAENDLIDHLHIAGAIG